MLLSGASLFALVFAMIEATHRGWTDPLIAGLVAAGLIVGAAFIQWELRVPHPMVKLELFRIHNFWVGNLTMALFNLGLYGTLLPLAVFLQGLAGYSPVEAGLVLVPSAAMMAVVAPIGGRLSDRIGSRRLLGAGFAVTALGQLLLATRIDPAVSAIELYLTMTVVGTGIGLLISQVNIVPMRDVPAAIAGSASGILNTTRTAAAMMSIAFLVSLLQRLAGANARATLAGSTLSEPMRDRAARLVGEGRYADVQTLGSAADQTWLTRGLPDLQAAFVDAMQLTLLVAAGTLLVGVAVSFLVRPVASHAGEAIGRPIGHAVAAD
jgi:predicted MFS family arabinose efflux permease